MTGKSTLFQALTRGKAQAGSLAHHDQIHIGTIPVPDERFDLVARAFKPKKITPATIEFLDGAARMGGERTRFDSDFFQGIRSVDALALVVRSFEDRTVPQPEEGLDPLRDVKALVEELILGDLSLVETRLERIARLQKSRRSGATDPLDAEKALLLRIREGLESERPVRAMSFNEEEQLLSKGFGFLTAKPLLVAGNIGEEEIGQEHLKLRELQNYCDQNHIPLIELCAKLEMEIAQLDEAEEAAYLKAMGIEEPARNKVIRIAYDLLGMISFFTGGENEARAWAIERGSTALEAAGKVHSDMARGFIRAEVVSFKHFKAAGSWDAAKHQGYMRVEGKDYVVQDGDILHIRFKI